VTECFSDTVQEEVRQFADGITPKNWNIFIHPKDFKYISGILNIQLCFLNVVDDFDDLDEHMAAVHGPMRVCLISFFKDHYPEAAEAFQQYGDGSFASSLIKIHPTANWDLEGTIIHELAHVAADRFLVFQQKPIKKNLSFAFKDPDEDPHGQLFQRFYRILLNRTAKVFGKEAVNEQWKHPPIITP